MLIGYARVSTQDQSLTVQEEAIKKYAADLGIEEKDVVIYKEKESGGKSKRKELDLALRHARAGDKFVVYKLDRLARSTKQLYELTDSLTEKGVEFVSIRDNLDTTTSTGRAMFGMLSVFAEFEKDIISERTKAGLESAKRQGRTGGRPAVDERTKRQIRAVYESGERAVDIAKEFNIGRSTVYKVLRESDADE